MSAILSYVKLKYERLREDLVAAKYGTDNINNFCTKFLLLYLTLVVTLACMMFGWMKSESQVQFFFIWDAKNGLMTLQGTFVVVVVFYDFLSIVLSTNKQTKHKNLLVPISWEVSTVLVFMNPELIYLQNKSFYEHMQI